MPAVAVALMAMPIAMTAHAQWRVDGAPMCTAVCSQGTPALVSDGSGGAIAVWGDSRTPTGCGLGSQSSVYAQRIDASGIARWTVDGVLLSDAGGLQGLAAVSDGAGGVLAFWIDSRAMVWGQRIDQLGSVRWTTGGVVVTTAVPNSNVVAVEDGADGAIVIHGGRAFHVSAAGSQTWAAAGVALGIGTDAAVVASDGQNGAYVATLTKVQRVGAGGAIASGWPAAGVSFCTASGSRELLCICSSGTSGVYLEWNDRRSDVLGGDLYAQRVLASGAIANGWASTGLPVCAVSGAVQSPALLTDGAGGVLCFWTDLRAAKTVYGQRLDANGAEQWASNGVAVTGVVATPFLYPAPAAPDGSGGAFVGYFVSGPLGDYDVWLQHVGANGGIALGWPQAGIVVCQAPSDQWLRAMVPDGFGGVLLAWNDRRSGEYDIYAQRVTGGGAVLEVPRRSGSSIRSAWASPNPSHGATRFGLAASEAALEQVEIFDAGGRCVRRWDGRTEPGSLTWSWDGQTVRGKLADAGLYFARLRSGRESALVRFAIVR